MKRLNYVLLVALVGSTAVNLMLAHALKSDRSAAGTPSLLEVGEKAPSFEAVDYQGAKTKVAFGLEMRPTVLYWLSPECQWCLLNLGNLEALERQAGLRFRVYALSSAQPEDLSGYAKSHQLNFPVYSVAPATAQALGLRATPATLLLGSNGRLVQRWVGAYTAGMQDAIERALGVKLPGLSKPGRWGG